MKGEGVSNGISFGQAYLIREEAAVEGCAINREDVDSEIERLLEGRARAAATLQELIEKVRREMGDEKAEIFEGHLEILLSEDLEEEVIQIIKDDLLCAENAVTLFSETNARDMEELEDDYFKERGQDFRDIGNQLVKGIRGESGSARDLPEKAIIVSNELAPSQTASLDMSRVAGFIVKTGGRNSHAAIIARSLEIPALILSSPDPLTVIRDDDFLAMDGFTGEVWINPDQAVLADLKKVDKKNKREKEKLMKLLHEPSVTKDGMPVGLYANVGGTYDVSTAVRYNADGIGLFRTEFLFMETMSSPSLERQTQVYKNAVEALSGKNVIIRLLDTGADKPLPYWQLPLEENPFLGIRGIRLLFQKEDVLRTQIQALLQASSSGPVGMMIPMISSLKPIERVKSLVEEEKMALGWTGPDQLRIGVMIETPAAVQLIEEILEVVDFISIGTNDLTQYTLAADRGNPMVNDYYDEFHPAVLRSIAHVIKKARKKGVMNGICGELAGNPLALPFFLGIGVEELSATPSRILQLKSMMRQIDSAEAGELVREILRLPTTEGIRARLQRFLVERNLPF